MIILRNLTEKEYKEKLKKIRKRNIQKQYRQSLREEGRSVTSVKIETSKLVMIYLMILFNAILLYAMIAMWKFQDLSYLGVLISDIAAQVIAYAIYCLKAYHGKKQEEQMKFEREKFSRDDEDVTAEDPVTE